MRTSRKLNNAMTLGLALACATSLWAAPAFADRDRDDRKGRKHHKREASYRDRDHDRDHDRHRGKKQRRHDHDRHVYRYDDRHYGYDCGPRRVYHKVRPVYVERPVYYQPVYYPVYYRDPYCGQNFTSLSIYFEHVSQHTHAGFALEFQVGSSTPAYACKYVDDRWVRIAHVSH